MITRLLIVIVAMAIGGDATSIFDSTTKGRCVPMQHKICSDLKYNATYYPSPISATEQSQIDHFNPLIKTKCHPQIKFFVCSVFEPMCPDQMPQAVTACRSICEEVKKECVSIIEEFGLAWPELLECSKFPSPPDLCMEPKKDEMAERPMSHFPRLSSSHSCPAFLVDTDEDDPDAPCALPCKGDVLFSAMHKAQLHKWLPGVAIASVAFSAFAFLTFLIDRSRFRFPERCIFYLSFCYLCYTLPFLAIGLDPTLQPACSNNMQQQHAGQQPHLLLHQLDTPLCTVSFFLTYYFEMAAALWWFMFAFTWYLSASRKWVPESLEAASLRVHVVAWFAPLVAAIVVVMTHSVDSSELTGLCGVGNTNRAALLFYSFLPRSIIGCLAIIFFVIGLTAMCKERNNFQARGTDTSKLDKLMIKTCIFVFIYVMLWLAGLAADLYHYAQLQAWQDATIGCKQSENPCLGQPPRPNGDIYLMQVLCPLFAFLGPFLWSFSLKTFSSFKRRICCCIWHPAQSKTPSRPLLDAAGGGSGLGGTVPGIPLPQPPAPRHQHQYVPLSTSSQPRWQHNHV